MWAKFVSDRYIFPAPEKYKGVENFNQKPDMMIQSDFKPVEIDNSPEGMVTPELRYTALSDRILGHYVDIYKQTTPDEFREQVLSQRDDLIKQYSVTRFGDYGVPESADNGETVSRQEEDKYLPLYQEYLRNVDKDPKFPHVEILSFLDWLKEKGVK